MGIIAILFLMGVGRSHLVDVEGKRVYIYIFFFFVIYEGKVVKFGFYFNMFMICARRLYALQRSRGRGARHLRCQVV